MPGGRSRGLTIRRKTIKIGTTGNTNTGRDSQRPEEKFVKTEFPEYFMGAGLVADQSDDDHQYFPSEEGACGDRYDRHGVKIEENNFI